MPAQRRIFTATACDSPAKCLPCSNSYLLFRPCALVVADSAAVRARTGIDAGTGYTFRVFSCRFPAHAGGVLEHLSQPGTTLPFQQKSQTYAGRTVAASRAVSLWRNGQKFYLHGYRFRHGWGVDSPEFCAPGWPLFWCRKRTFAISAESAQIKTGQSPQLPSAVEQPVGLRSRALRCGVRLLVPGADGKVMGQSQTRNATGYIVHQQLFRCTGTPATIFNRAGRYASLNPAHLAPVDDRYSRGTL